MTKKNNYILFIILSFSFSLFAGGTADIQEPTTVPSKIVSLSPAATEILFAIGAGENVIARTDFCNYPSEVLGVPSIGGFDGKAFSIESIFALEPDFVYATKGMHDHLQKPLESYGIQVYMSNAQTLDSIYVEINDIAQITGYEQNAQILVDQMQEKIDTIKDIVKKLPKKTVYWEVWHEPFMSAGNASYINDVIISAGGENIFADISQAYPVVSEESILIRNPDVMLLPTHTNTTLDIILSRDGWESLKAIKNSSIYFIDADITSRPGPRSAQAVEIIAKKLYPNEVF